jgi:hypothetical protein
MGHLKGEIATDVSKNPFNASKILTCFVGSVICRRIRKIYTVAVHVSRQLNHCDKIGSKVEHMRALISERVKSEQSIEQILIDELELDSPMSFRCKSLRLPRVARIWNSVKQFCDQSLNREVRDKSCAQPRAWSRNFPVQSVFKLYAPVRLFGHRNSSSRVQERTLPESIRRWFRTNKMPLSLRETSS